MNRLPARVFPAYLTAAALMLAAPLLAQQQSGTFTLPEATPTPSPAPAGPADERAGVAIPPRAAPSVAPSPVIEPLPAPTATRAPSPSPRDILTLSPSAAPRPAPQTSTSAPAPTVTPSGSAAGAPLPPPLPSASPEVLPAAPAPATIPSVAVGEPLVDLADWWPLLASALGAIAVLAGFAAWRRRRKPKVARLAPPVEAGDRAVPDSSDDAPRIDLTLEIISATRSVMMFTLQYRLTIANRSDRAVTDLAAAVELACARASAGNAPSAGAAQATAGIARVGPQQARSITGEVQMPLSAIQPLRQGMTPLFVPLVHITLDGEGLRAMSRSFVIGPPSVSGAGRLHPIPLDQPPGKIAGLIAQAITIPPVSAAA